MKLVRICGKLIPTFYLKIVDKDQLLKIKKSSITKYRGLSIR
jgi:hypothetical protein